MTVAYLTLSRLQDADDAPTLGSSQDGFGLAWNDASSDFDAVKFLRSSTNVLYVDPKTGSAYTKLSDALTAAAALSPATDNEVLIVVNGEVAETASLTALSHVHVLFLAGASVTVTTTGTDHGSNFDSLTNCVWAAVDPSRPHIIRAGAVGSVTVYASQFVSCDSTVLLHNLYFSNAVTGSGAAYGANVSDSNIKLINCTWVAATGSGASSTGIRVQGGSPTLKGCTGIGGNGGNTCIGIYILNGSTPSISDCIGIGGDGGTGCSGIRASDSQLGYMSNCTGIGGSGGATNYGIYLLSNTSGVLKNCSGIGGGAYRKAATATIAASSRTEDTFQPTASHPWRLTGITLNISAAAAGGVTLTLRDATGGGGNALSAATAVSSTGYVTIPITGHRIISAGNYIYATLSASDATLAYTISYTYETCYTTGFGLYHNSSAPVVIQDCNFYSNAASSAVYVTTSGDDASTFVGGTARSGLNDAGRQVAFQAQSSWYPARVFGMTLDGGTTNITGGIWFNATTNKLVGGGGIISPSIAPRTDSVTAIQLQNAAGTAVVNVDTTNSRVGVGENAPDYKLDVGGTFGFTPGSSVTPVDNGDVVIEATNNTTLTLKLKGSDGTVRSGTVTLS